MKVGKYLKDECLWDRKGNPNKCCLENAEYKLWENADKEWQNEDNKGSLREVSYIQIKHYV